jgi:hypothetical protein
MVHSGLNLKVTRESIKNLARIFKFSSSTTEAYYTDAVFSNDGTKMFVAVNDSKRRNGKIFEYNVTRPFDSGSSQYVRKIDFTTDNFNPPAGGSAGQTITKIGFNKDGSKLFALSHFLVTLGNGEEDQEDGDGNPPQYGWANGKKYAESYLYQLTLANAFSLESISSGQFKPLYANKSEVSPQDADGATLLGFFSATKTNENTYRVPTGFEFQEDGLKLFITSIRGHVAAAENEVTSDFTYFGDVCALPLTTAYDISTLTDQTSNTGFNSTNNMIVRKNAETAAKDAGVAPFDIVLHDGGVTMSILCLDTTTFNGIVYHYNLSTANDISTAKYESVTNIALTLPISLHVNNFSSFGERKNLSVVGAINNYFKPFNDITSGVLTKGGSSTIVSQNPFSIYQFPPPIAKSKPNNYYNYDPTKSKIIIKGGVEVYISNLKVNESKFEIGGMEFTFIGLVTKELNKNYHAIVVNPSGVIPLEVTLVDGVSNNIIQSQPYIGDATAQGQIEDQTGQPFNDVINNGGNV